MDNAGWLLLVLEWFGPTFICLSYSSSFIFDNPDTGYKYSILVGIMIYGIPYVLTLGFMPEGIRNVLTNIF